jgi:hypothetical protein
MNKVMEDSEVGELWRRARKGLLASGKDEYVTEKLIRKLVEERAQRLAPGPHFQGFIPQALREFNIDPATWPKEK